MKCLVTGAAGFVGSHLAERLSDLGHEVIGVDCFLDYYPRAIKERNVRAISDRANFRLVEQDVARHDLAPLLAGVDWVFHQAAQAGVRASWGSDFQIYAIHNVLGTQRLLEAAFTAEVGVERDPLQAQDGYIWYDVVGITPSRERSLDEVKEQVEHRWREQEIATRLNAKANELTTSLGLPSTTI